MASTYTSLAKTTTFFFALGLESGFVCSLISMLIAGHFNLAVFGLAALSMALFVLEYVGLHFKIHRLIICSCILWVLIAAYSIRTLIGISEQQLKGWVNHSRISIHSINFIMLTWQFIFEIEYRNYDLIWAIPFMLFACFKAEVHIRLAEEMMKETTEEPKMPPKPTMEKV